MGIYCESFNVTSEIQKIRLKFSNTLKWLWNFPPNQSYLLYWLSAELWSWVAIYSFENLSHVSKKNELAVLSIFSQYLMRKFINSLLLVWIYNLCYDSPRSKIGIWSSEKWCLYVVLICLTESHQDICWRFI